MSDEGVWESEVMVPLILMFTTRESWVSASSHALAPAAQSFSLPFRVRVPVPHINTGRDCISVLFRKVI